MLTAEILIGKVVEFIVGKSLSAIGKLSPNDRRKACRSLTKLYYSLQALEDVTESILQTASDFRGTETGEASAVMHALNNHMQEVALASNMFVDLGHELYAGLNIVDPALAACCDALYVSKFDFLREMSDTVAWDRTSTPGRIIIKMPKRTTSDELLNFKYAEASVALKNGDKYYWADTWLDTNEPHQVILTWEDHDSAKAFLSRLSEHRDTLATAKQKLRELLKSSFNIEELLFQTDAHPYR
ncbi:hypothetical protein AB4Z35_04170 [Pseudomonas sp. KB_15]|uniref:hypothetical protein n=1 Tax=Pseudomonas sp. KB_15 TaxID=3233035 RepID=UPI003F98BF04